MVPSEGVENPKLMVLNTPFVGKVRSLYDVMKLYNFNTVPSDLKKKLEQKIFKKTFDKVWEDIVKQDKNELKSAGNIEKADVDPKLKLQLVCRSYLSQTLSWAQQDVKKRRMDMEIWCGPSMGSFNTVFLSKHPE